MPEVRIGPWPLGMDVVSPRGALPRNEVGVIVATRDCVNGDFDVAGRFQTRAGLARAATNLGLRDAFAASGPRILGRVGKQIVAVNTETWAITNLRALPDDMPTSFCALPDGYAFVSAAGAGHIDGACTVARDIWAPDGPTPTIQIVAGARPPGRYLVAAAWAQEAGGRRVGGLSATVAVDMDGAHDFVVTTPAPPSGAAAAIVYASASNGDTLYDERGMPERTTGLRRMPGGRACRYWRGRLLVAGGRTMRFSDALTYGLHSPRHGFVQFRDRITFIEPVAGGVYVGQTDGVRFLAGTTPAEWELVDVGSARPVEMSSTGVRLIDVGTGGERELISVAVWLTTHGYVMGMPDGRIVAQQSRRVRLRGRSGTTVNHNGRLFTIMH